MNLSGPVDVDLRAQTRLAEAGLPLNLDVVSKQVYWPFTGDKQFGPMISGSNSPAK